MPKFEDEVTIRLVEILQRQEKSGIEEYGHTLADCPDDKFDWKTMAIEELIDCNKYQLKENMRLEKEVKRLRSILDGLGIEVILVDK